MKKNPLGEKIMTINIFQRGATLAGPDGESEVDTEKSGFREHMLAIAIMQEYIEDLPYLHKLPDDLMIKWREVAITREQYGYKAPVYLAMTDIFEYESGKKYSEKDKDVA